MSAAMHAPAGSEMHPAMADCPECNIEATIAAEVCERLTEWSEATSKRHVTRWLELLIVLHNADPAAMWLYLAWQTGDTTRIAESFDDRGARTALPRQAVQQATARALEAVRLVRPELAKAMRASFEAHSPEARAAGRNNQTPDNSI